MIEIICACGQATSVEESECGKAVICPACQGITTPICAEALEPGAAAGDFDAILTIEEGASRKGEYVALGGVADIQVGKLAPHLKLPGVQISRQHCLLRRVDFGPSRWQIIDNKSTHGLYVNGQRVSEAELKPGDRIQMGEYVLRYSVSDPAAALPPIPAMATPTAGLSAATLPPLPKTAPAAGAKTRPAKPQATTNDGWSADESQVNKMGLYVVMLPSIFAAMFASGFIPVEIPIAILSAIVGVCGIAGGIINIYGRGPLWAGALIGLVIGLGGFGAVAWWIQGREYVRKFELVIAFVVGAAPGFGIQALLQKLLKSKAE